MTIQSREARIRKQLLLFFGFPCFFSGFFQFCSPTNAEVKLWYFSKNLAYILSPFLNFFPPYVFEKQKKKHEMFLFLLSYSSFARCRFFLFPFSPSAKFEAERKWKKERRWEGYKNKSVKNTLFNIFFKKIISIFLEILQRSSSAEAGKLKNEDWHSRFPECLDFAPKKWRFGWGEIWDVCARRKGKYQQNFLSRTDDGRSAQERKRWGRKNFFPFTRVFFGLPVFWEENLSVLVLSIFASPQQATFRAIKIQSVRRRPLFLAQDFGFFGELVC